MDSGCPAVSVDSRVALPCLGTEPRAFSPDLQSTTCLPLPLNRSPTRNAVDSPPYFTNLDGHVFALINLPETVKGALFARYSRSAKSLRRLFLDEFQKDVPHDVAAPAQPPVGGARAEQLYASVFNEYGDDSVAQLGGAHVACEYVSNILTKVLERGRLMAYLEQSTRYVPYTDKLHGQFRYHVPVELGHTARCAIATSATMDAAFETYARLIPVMQAHFARRHPRSAADSEGVHRAAIRAKALDTLRGMLPAATQSNVGIYGSGQAYEALMLRMRAHPLEEVRACADAMLIELRKVIPAFLARVDVPERGGRWTGYLREMREAHRRSSRRSGGNRTGAARRGLAHRVRSRRRDQGRRRGALRGLGPS